MNKEQYHDFLQSKEWKAVRDMYLRDHKTCNMCGRPAEEVHHFIYEEGPLGYLNTENLTALCRSCHREVHMFDRLMSAFHNKNEEAAKIISIFSNMIDVKGLDDLWKNEQYHEADLEIGAYMYKLFYYAPNSRKYVPVFTLLSSSGLEAQILAYVAEKLPHPEKFLDAVSDMRERANEKAKAKPRKRTKKEADNG